MDLGFEMFDIKAAEALRMPPDFAVLLAGLSARQATSPTVRLQVRFADGEGFSPADSALVKLFAEGETPERGENPGRFSAAIARADPRSPR